MKYFSLFSGIGGFDLAMNRQGHKCVGYSEIDKYAIQTYQKNFGTDVTNYGDATKIKPRELPDFDMLCAGFPCQAFSLAGKGRGFNDIRGTLFFEIARILEAKKPPYFLLENVKGILSNNKGNTFRIILETLAKVGYEVQWFVLNSRFHGVPQNRERVFIIGSPRGQPRPEILPFRKNAGKVQKIHGTTYKSHRANQIRKHKGSPTLTSNKGTGENNVPMIIAPVNFKHKAGDGLKTREHRLTELVPSLQARTGSTQQSYVFDSYNKILKEDQANALKSKTNSTNLVARCLDAHMARGVTPKTFYEKKRRNLVGINRLRRLTPLECERLQSFSDGWTEGCSDSQRYKQLGNAVTVNVIEVIIKSWFK